MRELFFLINNYILCAQRHQSFTLHSGAFIRKTTPWNGLMTVEGFRRIFEAYLAIVYCGNRYRQVV